MMIDVGIEFLRSVGFVPIDAGCSKPNGPKEFNATPPPSFLDDTLSRQCDTLAKQGSLKP